MPDFRIRDDDDLPVEIDTEEDVAYVEGVKDGYEWAFFAVGFLILFIIASWFATFGPTWVMIGWGVTILILSTDTCGTTLLDHLCKKILGSYVEILRYSLEYIEANRLAGVLVLFAGGVAWLCYQLDKIPWKDAGWIMVIFGIVQLASSSVYMFIKNILKKSPQQKSPSAGD